MGFLLPDKLNNFNVYQGSMKLIGIASEVPLPKFEAMTETINGAGIAGEIDSPVEGSFGSQEIEIPFSNLSEDFFAYARSNEVTTLRGSLEVMDTGTQIKRNVPVVVTVNGPVKSIDPGVLKKGGKGEPKVVREVTYIKILVNGRNCLELDKLNMIYKLDGVDKLAAIRSQI